MNNLPDRVGHTVTFLRMTATELRSLVEHTPEIARELGYIAEQVETEAESLTGQLPSEASVRPPQADAVSVIAADR